jgi:hypothetical protein
MFSGLGHGGKVAASVLSGRLSPVPLIQGDGVDMAAAFLDDPVPGSGRASPVVKEQKSRLAGG